ncbi:ANTAR domain-containing protein [Streptomyces sp. NPDC086787]|uniref:ANTAR domain-containing protein n=1 Tax=Streptomyces sp. NPDC086787 TaxID=3365759 RepID=UPI003806F7FC
MKTPEGAPSQEEDLRAEVVQLRRAMQTRPVIDQAAGVLMASFGISPETAWNVLVTLSQNTNTKLHQLAGQLVATTQGGTLPEETQQHLAAAIGLPPDPGAHRRGRPD